MKDISDTKTQNSFEKKRSRSGFILLLICLFLAAVFIRRTATSTGIIMIGDSTIPIASFAGMFSMLTNICLIFLVVFYDKPGLITAVVFLAINFPILMMGIIVDHSFSSIPGLFGGLCGMRDRTDCTRKSQINCATKFWCTACKIKFGYVVFL